MHGECHGRAGNERAWSRGCRYGGPAARLLSRQRRLPLPRPGLRGAALRAGRPLGVAWLRIATAAAVFAAWRRPWRASRPDRGTRRVVALGVVLAAMNSCFYLAIARLPLGTVGAIEFLGRSRWPRRRAHPAQRRRARPGGGRASGSSPTYGSPGAAGLRPRLRQLRPLRLYVVLGHRIAATGASGIDRLGAAMLVAPSSSPRSGWPMRHRHSRTRSCSLAGIGVGVCSSVIPYVCDQLAMARLPRATFALMLALLPACATIIGVIVLRQSRPPAKSLALRSSYPAWPCIRSVVRSEWHNPGRFMITPGVS